MGLGFFWIGWDLSHMGFGIFQNSRNLLMKLFYLVVDFNPNAVFDLQKGGLDLQQVGKIFPGGRENVHTFSCIKC